MSKWCSHTKTGGNAPFMPRCSPKSPMSPFLSSLKVCSPLTATNGVKLMIRRAVRTRPQDHGFDLARNQQAASHPVGEASVWMAFGSLVQLEVVARFGAFAGSSSSRTSRTGLARNHASTLGSHLAVSWSSVSGSRPSSGSLACSTRSASTACARRSRLILRKQISTPSQQSKSLRNATTK
jgi:hypothetical protein